MNKRNQMIYSDLAIKQLAVLGNVEYSPIIRNMFVFIFQEKLSFLTGI